MGFGPKYQELTDLKNLFSGEAITMSSIEEQVKGIVAEQLGVKQEEVTIDASFVDDLSAD